MGHPGRFVDLKIRNMREAFTQLWKCWQRQNILGGIPE